MSISFNNTRNMGDAFGSVGSNGSGYYVLGSGPTFTARSVTTASDLFTDTAVVGDYMLYRMPNGCSKFAGIVLNIATVMVSVAHTIVWEYRKTDGTWTALAGVVDGTTNFTVAGTNTISWTVPTDWGTNATAFNGITGNLWVRGRLTVATTITEGGRTGGATAVKDYAVRVDASHEYDSGTFTAVTWTSLACTVTDNTKGWTVDALKNRFVYIHTGTRAGEFLLVKSNTATTITFLDSFALTPDTTSQYTICANFEDLYQADVAGGWGVITKSDVGVYSFACNLDFRDGSFGDANAMVSFTSLFYFYCGGIHTNRNPLILGWRLPRLYGLDKAIFGNTIRGVREAPMDNRAIGFTGESSYVFTAGNKFVWQHIYPDSQSDGFINAWFVNRQKYSIADYFEGWRSVTFAKVSPKTEVRALSVYNGYSGVEQATATFNGAKVVYSGALGFYLTGSVNYVVPGFEISPHNPLSGNRYSSAFQYFSTTGQPTIIDYAGPRQRPMNDIYSTPPLTFTSYQQYTVRAFIKDEYGNDLSNAKVQITDSLVSNRKTMLNFDGAVGNNDVVTAPNHATGNQFSGSTAFSFEASIYTRSAGGGTFGRVIDKGSGSSLGYGINRSGSSYQAYVYLSTGSKFSNVVNIPHLTWCTLFAVWDGATIRLGVDDSFPAGSAAVGTPNNDTAQTLFIGNSSTLAQATDGFIRRVRLYRNKALTSAETLTLWNNGDFIQDQVCPVSGCTAEYNFTEGSGTTLADTSGNGVTATLGAATAAPAWVDSNLGLTTQSLNATTGTLGNFLSLQAVAHLGTYSLTSQPTSATRLRFTVTKYRDSQTSGGQNSRIEVAGTDKDGNAIFEIVFLEEFGNGIYFTNSEFLTIDTLGILVTGPASATMTIDNVGVITPTVVSAEAYKTPDDTTLLVADYNPVFIKVSRPGYETTVIKKYLYEKQDLTISLKKSELDLT